MPVAVAKRAARAGGAAAVVKREPESPPERTPSPESKPEASLHMGHVEEFGVSDTAVPPQPALPLVEDTRPVWQSCFGDIVAADALAALDALDALDEQLVSVHSRPSCEETWSPRHELSPAPRRWVEEQQAESEHSSTTSESTLD